MGQKYCKNEIQKHNKKKLYGLINFKTKLNEKIISKNKKSGELFSNNKKFGIAYINTDFITSEKSKLICGDSELEISLPWWCKEES